jgi:hypothetical protein
LSVWEIVRFFEIGEVVQFELKNKNSFYIVVEDDTYSYNVNFIDTDEVAFWIVEGCFDKKLEEVSEKIKKTIEIMDEIKKIREGMRVKDEVSMC